MSQDSTLAALSITVNGLVMAGGQPVRLAEVRGLDDLADIRTFDSARDSLDGLDFGTDLFAGRVIEVDLFSRPASPATVLAQLRAALVKGDSTMVVSGLPGLPDLQLTGRIRKRRLPTNQELAVGVLRPTFDFECSDPRLYAAAETVLTSGPGTSSGTGLTPPLTPPFTPGGSAVGGLVSAVNAGGQRTSPRIRIDGPVTAFSLLNSTTQRKLTYLQALAAGQFVEIDMDARTVLLGGTASRRAYMAGTWWDLAPGNNDVFYLPADAAVGSLMTLRFRSAY